MNLDRRTEDELQSNHRLSFNVVVAYEDFSAGNHALGIVNRLFPDWPHSPSLSTQNVWKFDLLEIAKFRDLAAAEAAYADMIVISAHDAKALPAAVKRWMELWVRKREQNPGALVVLLDEAQKHGIRDLWAESYFQMCAVRAGMDIFIQREQGRPGGKRSNRGTDLGKNLPSPATLGKIITNVPWQRERH